MEKFHPLRNAWAVKKSELGLLKRQIMEVLEISTDVQFYDVINGNRKVNNPLHRQKLAELFGQPEEKLFPDTETVFE